MNTQAADRATKQITPTAAAALLAQWQDHGHGLVLLSNGAEWTGTYAVMVKALIDDLISDGEPVKMVLLYEPIQDDPEDYTLITAEVTGWARQVSYVGDLEFAHMTDVITFVGGSHAVIEGLIGVFV